MAARDEMLSESMLPDQRRRTSLSSATSVVNFTDRGPGTADQKFETQFGHPKFCLSISAH